jgi:hypothetical protein
MAGQGGFWKKVAGAFVEFDDPKAPPTQAAPPSSVEDDLASAERLLRELNAGSRGAEPAKAPARAADPFPPTGGGTPASGGGQTPPAFSPPTLAPAGDGSGAITPVPFADLYTGARVPPVHNTAEQMLAILDGLAAMPPEACRMAVTAMDAADDRWTVADVLVDARLKVEALAAYTAQVSERATAAVTKAEADRAAIDKGLTEAESAIQQQIAQLQAELASFQADAAEERARIDAELQAVKEGVASEAARVQAEIARLGRVRTFLEPMVPGSAPR